MSIKELVQMSTPTRLAEMKEMKSEHPNPEKVVVVGAGADNIAGVLRNYPESTLFTPGRRSMALGDTYGTVVRAGRQCGKTRLNQAMADLKLKNEVEQMNEEIRDARGFLEGTIGVRRTVKSLYARLKIIQQFNEVMTGSPRPIHLFFPDALAITLFATNHLKIKPGRFRAVLPEDRWVFTGLVKHYMEKPNG